MSEENNLLNRISLNQITIEKATLKEAVLVSQKQEIPWISIWRHKIHELGLKESKRIIQQSGLQISSICRGGMFPASTKNERIKNLDENKKAIEEAAELGTDVLVLVCGAAPDKNITLAREWIEEGIEDLVPFAKQYGIKLALEPLHPMYAADRSAIVTLNQANKIAQNYSKEEVGLIIDVFHVWWDPELYEQIKLAEGRILGFHVSDWKMPITDTFKARHMMGDGVIEIHKIRKAVHKAGYEGPIEVEIMNQELWDTEPEKVVKLMKERFLKHV